MKIKYPKIRELKEAVRSLFSKPFTSRFPAQKHEPAKKFRGRPFFYEKDCVGCTACAQVCPAKAIFWEDKKNGDSAMRHLFVNWDICIFCGQCEANCITGKGIRLSRDFDLATTESRNLLKQEIEKELLICEVCGEIVTPIDQYAWVAEKIGPLSFTNASLMLFYLRTLEISSRETDPKNGGEILRRDRIKVVCPRCRRQAAIKS
jgi:hydrogenase-4 component H